MKRHSAQRPRRLSYAINHKPKLVLGLVLLLIVVKSGQAVLAHARPVQIFPPPGSAHLGTPPEIRLIFDEPVQDGMTLMLTAQGSFVPVAGISVQRDLDAPEQIFATLPDLPASTYSVQWEVISADGHPLVGQFTFETGVSVWELIDLWQLAIGMVVLLIIVTWVNRKREVRRK